MRVIGTLLTDQPSPEASQVASGYLYPLVPPHVPPLLLIDHSTFVLRLSLYALTYSPKSNVVRDSSS